jgi:hypothetical protein
MSSSGQRTHLKLLTVGDFDPQTDRAIEYDFIGRVIAGRYTIQAHIGGGGMADVYRATDEELGVDVAIKLLKPRMASDELRARICQGRPGALPNLQGVVEHPGHVRRRPSAAFTGPLRPRQRTGGRAGLGRADLGDAREPDHGRREVHDAGHAGLDRHVGERAAGPGRSEFCEDWEDYSGLPESGGVGLSASTDADLVVL